MEALYISSMEKVLEARPSGGMSLDVVLANRYASKFWDLGTYLMLKSLNELVMSPLISDNSKYGGIRNGSNFLPI